MRISYSALETYRNCPLKYKYQNIDHIKELKSKEAVFGTIIHSALKFAHTPGILSPTLEQTLDYFSRNWNSDVFEIEAEERAAFSQGVEMIRKYYEKNNIAAANIIDLESRFAIDLEGNIISGIIDRIDKTEEGYEIIDYKTAKKMPSQEYVNNNLQLSVYLKAFLARYPEEVKSLDKIKVSLYFLKHGVKLSATRNLQQLQKIDEEFLEVIKNIEEGKFDPNITPLCDWCGYQKLCPMWRHKFKNERKIDTEEVSQAIEEYISAKEESKSLRYKIAALQEKVSQYMDQEGVERVFSKSVIIARTLRKIYKYNDKKIKEILYPLGQWDEVVKIDGIALKKILPTLSRETKKEIEQAQEINKESRSFSVKKQNSLDENEEVPK